MSEFNVDSHYGRFVGTQYDLNESVKYQEEVILVVRARVSEKTFRTTRGGLTREISVVSPEEVFVAAGGQKEQLQRWFGIADQSGPVDLGKGIKFDPTLTSLELVEKVEADVSIDIEDPDNIKQDIPIDVEEPDDIKHNIPVSVPLQTDRRVPIGGRTRDSVLARFLDPLGDE